MLDTYIFFEVNVVRFLVLLCIPTIIDFTRRHLLTRQQWQTHLLETFRKCLTIRVYRWYQRLLNLTGLLYRSPINSLST